MSSSKKLATAYSVFDQDDSQAHNPCSLENEGIVLFELNCGKGLIQGKRVCVEVSFQTNTVAYQVFVTHFSIKTPKNTLEFVY